MATAAIGAAKWVLGKVVSKLSDNALEAWAATEDLGGNVRDLKKELLCVHATLHGTQGKEMSSNPALVELLQQLGELSDEAEDMLDELDYFRIQDQLDDTHEAADQPDRGMCCDALFHARHAAVNVVTKWLPCLPAFDGERRHFLGCASLHGGCMDGLASAANPVGKSLLCSSCLPAVPDVGAQEPLLPAVPHPVVENIESEAPKLVFDRVGMSNKMKRIVGELRPMCAQVTALLHQELSKSNNRTAPPKRPETSSTPLDDTVFGRDGIRDKIIAHMIGGDKHVAAKDDLSVILIWGHGGMGKTTLAQYVYNDPKVNMHFDVKVWICVSHGFDVTSLTREILTGILVYLGEQGNSSLQGNLDQLQTQIEKKLESKKLLLVLDDVWQDKDKHGFLSKNIEQGWKQLIAPLRKGPMKGNNALLVTSRFISLADEIKVADDCKIELKGLEDEEFQKYFYTCTSGDENWKPQEDDLKEIGNKIVKKLKGSPLAAKTVGRLLGTDLSAPHWREVLESKEWESQKNDHDIMPALKLSFDYLPFHLQECFSFCALFSEDYEFGGEELIRFWMGAGIIYSNYYDQSKRVEDIGAESLKELVYHGFVKRIEREQGLVFVMHDLMHDLAVQVSSHKYLSVNNSNIKSTHFSSSVCHLSIFIDGDIKYYEDFRKVFCESKKKLKIENLRTLIFGGYDFVFTDIFRDVFREAKGLRVLHLSDKSDPPESILHNFSEFVHLRYLRLATRQRRMSLPKALSRFYQLKVLDLLEWRGNCNLPRDMSNLRMLRHFVADEEMHSSIVEVGKLECLQEIKRFNVGTINDAGFELRQLGALMELRGSLSVCNLENVKNREEAGSAKLLDKSNLDKLKLVWEMEESNNKPVHRLEETLEGLRPHPNLQKLHIQGHGGTTCPTWLDTNIAVKYLKSLCLHNVAWKTFPAFGQLSQLKRLELVEMNKLEKWVGGKTCHLFSNLEFLIVKNCPKLVEIPSSRHSSASTQDENNSLFPRLKELEIASCPNLSVLPPTPCASTLCSIKIKDVGSYLNILEYSPKHSSISPQKTEEFSLRIELKEHRSIDFQSLDKNMLAFHNLTQLAVLEVKKCPPLALKHLQMLASLKRLEIRECKRVILDMYEETNLNWQLPIEFLEIYKCGVSGKELSQLLSYLPALSCLKIRKCRGIKRMGMVEEVQQHEVIEEDEELLLFPSDLCTSLQELELDDCSDLNLMRRSRVFQCLSSLQSLTIRGCPNLFSAFDLETTPHYYPFPSSLQSLELSRVQGIHSSNFSNLTSLTSLDIPFMGWDEVEQHVLIHVTLNRWQGKGRWGWLTGSVLEKGKGEEKEPPHLLPSSSSHPHPHPHPHVLWFRTDDLPGFLMAPSLCTRLSSSLQTLVVIGDYEVEGFTAEQEQALQLLTSLQVLEFDCCWQLQSLPAGLHRLRNLKRLVMECCPQIRNGVAELISQGNLMELTVHRSPNVFSADWEPSRGAAAATALPNSSRLQKLRTDDLPGFLMAPSLCTRLSSSLQTLVRKMKGFTAEQEQALQLRNRVAELLTQGNLMQLKVSKSPNVFSADWEPSRGAAAATALPNSSRLQKLRTDDLPGFLMAPSLCTLLSSSLQTLVVKRDEEVEGFTAEQVQALQLLTSLQVLKFKSCKKLRSLPAGLHRLRNLKRLQITYCPKMRSLPKEGLPSSLQRLDVSMGCSNELKRECSKLRNIPEIILFHN